ncbi:MAG: GumC family protein [Anaerolineaceae bacterium]|nr:GumC family protein [Anaerolineaceae bacterium]
MKLDPRSIMKTLDKHRKMILGTFILFTAVAVIYSYNTAPIYEAETTLRFKQPNGLVNSLVVDQSARSSGAAGQQLSTYAEILKSRTVLQEVIENTQGGKGSYESMVGRITTQPVRDTDILRVKVTARSPEEAQSVTNALTEAFIRRLTELSRSEQSLVRKFIGDRLNESKGELDKAEMALQQYKNTNRITDPETETKTLVEAVSSVNRLAADNAVNSAAARGKLANAQRQLSEQNPAFIADNPMIQQFKTKLADLEVQMAGLTQKYTAIHPDVVATQAAIQETQHKLNAEIARVINAESASMNPIHQLLLQGRITAETEIAASSAQQAAIAHILQANEQELAKLPEKERGLAKVMRDAAVAREIYIMLAKRYEEARISEVMQPTEVQLIDAATFPTQPIASNKVKHVIIGAVAGLIAGIGLAFASEYLNKSVRTAEDVKRYLDLPVLANIPHFDREYQPPKISLWGRLKQMTS